MQEQLFQISPGEPIYQTVKDQLEQFFKNRLVFSTEQLQEIELCLVEAIQNARIHGETPQSVRCALSLGEDELMMKIWDHNPPFYLKDKMQLPIDPYAEGGRGLVIIEQLVDGLALAREGDGNCLTLTKLIRRPIGTMSSTDDPLDLLYEISESIVQANEVNFDRIYELVLDKAIDIFGVDRASVMNFDPERGLLHIVASRGLRPEVVRGTYVKPGEGVSGWVFKERKPILIHGDEGKNKASSYKSQSFISAPMLCSPMRMGKTCMGVINITERRDGRPFEEKDLKLLTTLANQAAAYVRMGHLIEQVKESEKIEQELVWARKIQRSLLPQEVFQNPALEVYGHCEMARQVGGDYFDYMLQGPYLYVVVADVSGHNLPAALTMVNFRSVLRSQISVGGRPREILERTNRLIYADLASNEQQITAALLRFHLSDKTVLYANAGHHPIFYLDRDKQEAESLYADGILLGAIEEAQFEEKERTWQPSDHLLLYTDGIVESRDKEGRVFGQAALARLVAAYRQLPSSTLVHLILKDAHRHIGSRPVDDDLTLMHVALK